MNRPDFLQYLTKGKILSSKIFPKFVETWNWLVSAFDSFVGDANLNPVEGFILVDRTDPSRPILRLTNIDKLGEGGEGGGGGDSLPRPFDPILDDDGVLTGVSGGYYQIGGFTYHHDKSSVSSSGFVCLSIDANDPDVSSVTSYSDFDSLRSAQKDLSKVIIPLYVVANNEVEMDLRHMPYVAMLENFGEAT